MAESWQIASHESRIARSDRRSQDEGASDEGASDEEKPDVGDTS